MRSYSSRESREYGLVGVDLAGKDLGRSFFCANAVLLAGTF